MDLFISNYGQPNKVWINNGSGGFSDSGQALGNSYSQGVALGNSYSQGVALGNSYSQGVALGDVDRDGDLDAFVVNRWNQPNKVWINDGAGNFTDSGQSLGNYESFDVALGDLDSDGDIDAFVANGQSQDPQPNRIWLNDGNGTFSDSGQTLANFSTQAVALGDLDNDGDLDAFTNTNSQQPAMVWLNNGNAVFSDSGQRLGDAGFGRKDWAWRY